MQNIPEKTNLSDYYGLVISYFGNSVAVEKKDGSLVQCHLRRNQEVPVVGDYVHFKQEGAETGVILSIEPRRSMLSRGDAKGKMKPIAANIDSILIVMSPPPIFSEYIIDRYLVAAELLKIKPVIVLNKIDLLTDQTQDSAFNRLNVYSNISYPVILSSIFIENGLAALKTHLQDKTAVLVGPSGVGKSSIIAGLGGEDIRIGTVSSKGIGKHTTTATRLYHTPHGGRLIDSPGVRDFNLWPINKVEVLQGFKEFESYTKDCKFRDCQHLVEPGCRVQEAVNDGRISPIRFSSYQALMREAK